MTGAVPSGCCTDSKRGYNYDADASEDDGSCLYAGCTDAAACNYDADADTDDGTCTFPDEGYNCQGYCLHGLRWRWGV